MAYGLHAIAHKNYIPYGSGRDWFFIGDFEYRNGRKTPTGNQSGQRPQRPPAKRRGEPAEVAFHKSVLAGSGKAKTIERWRRAQAENSEGSSDHQLRAQRASRSSVPHGSEGATFAATSWQLGRIPAWDGGVYELNNAVELEGAGAIRSASAPELQPGPGDHTRGIRGPTLHFASQYSKLGNDPSFTGKRFDLPNGTELQAAGAIRDGPQAGYLGPGNHTRGVCARAPHFTADSHRLGQVPGFQQPEVGHALKHTFHSTPCYPDVVRRPKASPGKEASTSLDTTGGPEEEYRAGDHTMGIRAQRPHFTSTYNDHGQIPGWKGKRYDFGTLAVSRFRLTEWGRDAV